MFDDAVEKVPVPSPGVEAPSNSPLPRERQNGAEMPSVLVTNLEIERNGKLKGAGLRVNLLSPQEKRS
jgi:hypothetical protein